MLRGTLPACTSRQVEHLLVDGLGREMEEWKMGGYVVALTIMLSCQSLLITFSKNSNLYSYNTTSAILSAEVVKFLLSALTLWWYKMDMKFRINFETLPYCIPALIYFVQNNLVFYALIYVDPTTYLLLNNLKILTTGILFRYILKRELSSLQWGALVLLMVGCSSSQIASGCNTTSIFAVPFTGILICVILSILSAAAGIYTEYIMKVTSLKVDSLQTQNMHLYFFGIIFNTIGYLYEKEPGESFFDGYNFATILVVASYSFTGLIVSVIMKYADNMVKIYSTAVSMSLTMVISVLLFNFEPTPQLFFGIVIITISLLMYFGAIGPLPVSNLESKKEAEV